MLQKEKKLEKKYTGRHFMTFCTKLACVRKMMTAMSLCIYGLHAYFFKINLVYPCFQTFFLPKLKNKSCFFLFLEIIAFIFIKRWEEWQVGLWGDVTSDTWDDWQPLLPFFFRGDGMSERIDEWPSLILI
jgi:hypothetical protein